MSDNMITFVIVFLISLYVILGGFKIYQFTRKRKKSGIQFVSMILSLISILAGFFTPLGVVIGIVVSYMFLILAYLSEKAQ